VGRFITFGNGQKLNRQTAGIGMIALKYGKKVRNGKLSKTNPEFKNIFCITPSDSLVSLL